MRTTPGDFDHIAHDAGEIARKLNEARALFTAGMLHAAADKVSLVNEGAAKTIGAEARRDFLLYGLACYGLGDVEAALRRHHQAPPSHHSALRYRMLIARKQWPAARRLRRAMIYPARVSADFQWTLSRQSLWSNRVGRGLRLYAARVMAENFSRIKPGWIDHAPELIRRDSVDAVLLEQGVGDVLFHISQMAHLDVRPLEVFGVARQRRLVGAIWPNAAFHDVNEGPPEGRPRVSAACAADWLAIRWRHDATLGELRPLNALAQVGRQMPSSGFGICWRGGSGQNRREEREIPLQFFLDLLPKGPGYVVLQHDLTEEERKLLAARPDISPPDIDLTADDLATSKLINRLQGVITVDSANAHFAGVTGTPLCMLMNERPHWYWGSAAKAETVFAAATTIPMNALSRPKLEAWINRNIAQQKRSGRPKPIKHRPIFITGAPRSRTSMIAGALVAGGVRFGDTIGPTPENASGFAENRGIREDVLKPLLARSGFDPLGVRALPPIGWNPPAHGLREQVLAALDEETEHPIWGYKDPKLLLMWRRWARAFPEATWILVDRPAAAVAKSCQRTSFMRRHAAHESYWTHFVRSYHMRADDLAASLGSAVLKISSDDVERSAVFSAEIRVQLSDLGIDVEAAEAFLRKSSQRH